MVAKRPRRARSLAQLKTDARRKHKWPWKIRHPNDEQALLQGCYPDFEAAERVRRFYAKLLLLPSAEHESGTKPFHLLDWWYRDVIAPLFGWKRADGRRRFDKGFVTTGKKSGKSTVLAGLPLYMITADDEEEAEAYATAVDRDQASIIFEKSLRSAKLSRLKKALHILASQKKIKYDHSGSWFEAISSDADSTEGKNPHLLLVDELHAWKDRQFFNALMYGDIARSQPLFLMITTAGDDLESIGREEYEFAADLINPDSDFYSMSHFGYIAEADKSLHWDDPEGWKQANPSLEGEEDTERPKDEDEPTGPRTLGSVEKLQDKCDEARQSPRKQRHFTRYICNRWIGGGEDAWIDIDEWYACGSPILKHKKKENIWVGLDLSSTRDLSSLCKLWQCDDGILDLDWLFWTPEDKLKEHEDQWKVPLRDWVKQGWVRATPGDIISYAAIREEISGVRLNDEGEPLHEKNKNAIARRYHLRNVGYDPWNAGDMVEQQLYSYDGVEVTEVRMGFKSMNPPCKEFERLVTSRGIRHGNNPVMNWMIQHCIVDEDPAGNIKPNKKKSRQKIDGVVASIAALAVHIVDRARRKPNVYNRRGMLTT